MVIKRMQVPDKITVLPVKKETSRETVTRVIDEIVAKAAVTPVPRGVDLPTFTALMEVGLERATDPETKVSEMSPYFRLTAPGQFQNGDRFQVLTLAWDRRIILLPVAASEFGYKYSVAARGRGAIQVNGVAATAFLRSPGVKKVQHRFELNFVQLPTGIWLSGEIHPINAVVTRTDLLIPPSKGVGSKPGRTASHAPKAA
jgi:hypothetical protein